MPKIISWNTQGNGRSKLNSTYSLLLEKKNDNIIMIQEGGDFCKNYGEVFQYSLGVHNFNAIFFDQPNAKSIRCTTGMLVEDGFKSVQFKAYPGYGKRPIVICECTYPDSYDKRAYAFATVHLTANEIAAKKEIQDTYNFFFNQYGNTCTPWLIMGDMNCRPQDLKVDFEMNISYPNGMTQQGGKTLDFAVFSDSMKSIANIDVQYCCDTNVNIPMGSDHFPICCKF